MSFFGYTDLTWLKSQVPFDGKLPTVIYNDSELRKFLKGTEEGNLALICAIDLDQPKAFDIIIQRGINFKVMDEFECSLEHAALYHTFKKDDDLVSDMFLKKLIMAGIDVNSKSDSMTTPLNMAVTRNLPSATKILLEAGAKVNTKAASDKSVLENLLGRVHPNTSMLSGFESITTTLSILLQHGANFNSQIFNKNKGTFLDALVEINPSKEKRINNKINFHEYKLLINEELVLNKNEGLLRN